MQVCLRRGFDAALKEAVSIRGRRQLLRCILSLEGDSALELLLQLALMCFYNNVKAPAPLNKQKETAANLLQGAQPVLRFDEGQQQQRDSERQIDAAPKSC